MDEIEQEDKDREFYPTPKFAFDRLLEMWEPPSGLWLDPCAGDGAFQRHLSRRDGNQKWVTNDIIGGHDFNLDFTTNTIPPGKFDFIPFNPPFSKAIEFIQNAMKQAPVIMAFVRVTWLGSKERNDFLTENPPSRMFFLPDRLKNRSPGKRKPGSDNVGRVWLVWGTEPGQSLILRHTPKEERD